MLDEIKQLLAQGEAEEALRRLRPLAGQQPRSAEVQLGLSEAYFQLGAGPRAVMAARQAVRLARRDAAAHYQLGRILSTQGHWTEAETALQQALKLSPGYAPAQAELDRVRQALGQNGTPRATAASTPSPPPPRWGGEPWPPGRERRTAGSWRPWVLAVMSMFVVVCCATIVLAALQPRWTSWQRQQEPQPQATTQLQALVEKSLPAPSNPASAEPTVQPNPPSPPLPAAPTPSRPQGPTEPMPSQGLRPTDLEPTAGNSGEGKGGKGGVLIACPLCGSSGWMPCPYCLISSDPKCEMCGGRKEVVCWFCGGTGQARRLPNGEIIDNVGDHMPTETIPNEPIRQAVERYRKTGEIPPQIKEEVEKFLKQSIAGSSQELAQR